MTQEFILFFILTYLHNYTSMHMLIKTSVTKPCGEVEGIGYSFHVYYIE